MDDSITGQKVFTGVGAGRAYQEVISEFCWDQRNYIFKLSSTWIVFPMSHELATPTDGPRAPTSTSCRTEWSTCARR